MNITFVHALSFPVLFLIVSFTVAFLAYAYHRFSVPSGIKTRIVLLLLRMILLATVFFIILDPYWRRPRANEWLGILIDTSKSMQIKDPGPQSNISRMEQLREFFKSNPDWKLVEKNKLREIITFDSKTSKAADLTQLDAEGNASRVISSVKEINSRYQTDPDLLGFMVFSDGAATDDTPEHKENFGELTFPWIAAGMGREGAIPNLRMLSPEIPKNVFVGEVVPLKIYWESTLPRDNKTKLRVLLDQKPVLEKEVAVKDLSLETQLSVREAGDHVLDIQMSPVEGEGSAEDNSVRIWFKADIRQIRVFYAESFYKNKNYFKEALEEDVDFVVSFASSLVGFARKYGVPFFKSPLYGFPKTREELLQYDMLVLSDVKRNLLTSEQIGWIQELVQNEGGALMMVGGMDSFGDGGYSGTEIEKMLPVEISEEYKKQTFLTARGTVENPFRPLLSPGAENHPVMQLDETKTTNESLWKNIPALGGYNYVGRLKPGATILLQHPVDISAFGPRVILAVQNFGRGKVMAFTSDITPNWGEKFQDWRDAKHGWLYAKFWRKTLKWMTENRTRRRVAPMDVNWEPALAEDDQPLRFTISVPGKKEENKSSSLTVEILKEGKSVFQKEFDNIDAETILAWKVNSLAAGDYFLLATYFRKDAQPLQLKTPFTVHPSRVESRNLELRPSLLRALADQSQGVYLPFSDGKGFDEAINKIRKVRLQQYSVPFWNQPWMYLLIVVLLSMDWAIRKKKGLE